MYSLKTCLLLAAATHGATIQERAVVPFRAPKVPEHPDFVTPGSGGLRPGVGTGGSEAGAWAGIAAGGRGTAPESTTPLQPGFYERNKELIEKAVEVEEKLFGDCFETHDQVEGMACFLSREKPKPKPVFTNN